MCVVVVALSIVLRAETLSGRVSAPQTGLAAESVWPPLLLLHRGQQTTTLHPQTVPPLPQVPPARGRQSDEWVCVCASELPLSVHVVCAPPQIRSPGVCGSALQTTPTCQCPPRHHTAHANVCSYVVC